jgi:hypothetical protein
MGKLKCGKFAIYHSRCNVGCLVSFVNKAINTPPTKTEIYGPDSLAPVVIADIKETYPVAAAAAAK